MLTIFHQLRYFIQDTSRLSPKNFISSINFITLFKTENKGGRMEKYNNILERFFNVSMLKYSWRSSILSTTTCLPKTVYLWNVVRNMTLLFIFWQSKSGNKNIKIIFLHQSKFYFLNAISSNFCTPSHSGCISFLSFLYLSSVFASLRWWFSSS